MKSVVMGMALFTALFLSSCVQKSYERVVVVTLDASREKDVKWAGIRGDGNPLKWDTDYPMKEIAKDSLYRGIFTTKTGYLFTEIKCTANGNFELQQQDNRRISFDVAHDTTFVNLIFNKR